MLMGTPDKLEVALRDLGQRYQKSVEVLLTSGYLPTLWFGYSLRIGGKKAKLDTNEIEDELRLLATKARGLVKLLKRVEGSGVRRFLEANGGPPETLLRYWFDKPSRDTLTLKELVEKHPNGKVPVEDTECREKAKSDSGGILALEALAEFARQSASLAKTLKASPNGARHLKGLTPKQWLLWQVGTILLLEGCPSDHVAAISREIHVSVMRGKEDEKDSIGEHVWRTIGPRLKAQPKEWWDAERKHRNALKTYIARRRQEG